MRNWSESIDSDEDSFGEDILVRGSNAKNAPQPVKRRKNQPPESLAPRERDHQHEESDRDWKPEGHETSQVELQATTTPRYKGAPKMTHADFKKVLGFSRETNRAYESLREDIRRHMEQLNITSRKGAGAEVWAELMLWVVGHKYLERFKLVYDSEKLGGNVRQAIHFLCLSCARGVSRTRLETRKSLQNTSFEVFMPDDSDGHYSGGYRGFGRDCGGKYPRGNDSRGYRDSRGRGNVSNGNGYSREHDDGYRGYGNDDYGVGDSGQGDPWEPARAAPKPLQTPIQLPNIGIPNTDLGFEERIEEIRKGIACQEAEKKRLKAIHKLYFPEEPIVHSDDETWTAEFGRESPAERIKQRSKLTTKVS